MTGSTRTANAEVRRPLAIAAAPNLRDVGGLGTAAGGFVRTGLLYRSSALNRLDGADAAGFARLGIRTVYDFRTATERAREPDRLPSGTEYVVSDVIGDEQRGSPAHIMGLLASPEAAREGLGNGQGLAMWIQHYRDFVRLESARAAYGRFFRGLAVADARPALMHCTTGKDRTGWGAAALLLLLDVPWEVVLEDFLLSGVYLRPLVRPMLDRFEADGGDPDLLRPITDVHPAYLEAARTEMLHAYGGLERYFAEGLGVDATTQEALRAAFLQRA